MSRTPLLDALRASYQRQEDEVKAPLLEALDWQSQRAERLRRQLCDLSVIIGRKVGDAIFADMGRDMARTLVRMIREACAKVDYREPTFKMELPTSELRWINPESLDRLVLKAYLLKLKTDRSTIAVSFRSRKMPDYDVTSVTVEIPSIAIERALP